MRKILLCLLFVSTISCNKDDNGEKQLTPNYENMAGDWDFKTIVRPNGSEEVYPELCSTHIDFVQIEINATMTSYHYHSNCVGTSHSWYPFYFEGNRIKNAIEMFDNARVTSLTATTMKIEYDNPSSFSEISGQVKGLILTKR